MKIVELHHPRRIVLEPAPDECWGFHRLVADGLYEKCVRCGRSTAPSRVRRVLVAVGAGLMAFALTMLGRIAT